MTLETPKHVVELKNISKIFSGVRALENISFSLSAGECLGLVGENGAGKSTLVKILSGVWPDGSFAGEVFLDGKPRRFRGPRAARDVGVAIIHQELSLFEELSVAENIFISDLPAHMGVLHKSLLIEKTQSILKRFHFPMAADQIVKNLSVGQQQLVEIARAFTKPLRVLIFDEPTSALSNPEIEVLFGLIQELKKLGVACIYISHKLQEVRKLCDRVVVLRDGKYAGQFHRDCFTDQELIEVMVGRKIESVFPPKRALVPDREVILRAERLHYVNRRTHLPVLSDVSFDLRRGEVLGIAGLMGSRRTELLSALFGASSAERISGRVLIEGREVEIRSPAEAIREGLAFVTEDRKASGLVSDMDVKGNLTLAILNRLSSFFRIRQTEEEEWVDYYCRILRIKTPDMHFKVRDLSGGNQQKVILGRWLATQPKILLLDEPTRGIDVLAKAEIYHLIRQLVDQGLSLILVSSELPELVSLSDRVMVMRDGRVAGILEGELITQTQIMERAAA